MKALVVYKKSSYELYLASPDETVQKFAKSKSPLAVARKTSHEVQQKCLDSVVDTLAKKGVNFDAKYRAELEPIKGYDLAISIGGDGTFLETARYIKDRTPILGVNSDPNTSVGYFCAANADTFSRLLGKGIWKDEVTRLSIWKNKEQIPYFALNDILVAHKVPAATTRILVDDYVSKEEHKCSGLLACTAAGSTGWMHQEGGVVMEYLDDSKFQYRIRGHRGSGFHFSSGIKITSNTREGRAYIDGEHVGFDFTLEDEILISRGLPLVVVGMSNILDKRAAYWKGKR